MYKTVYDVVHRRYRLHRSLPKAQERLAQAINASGKIRLDADTESNFVRLLLPGERINMTFTRREITDVKLYTRSYERLLAAFARNHDAQKAQNLTRQAMEKVKEDLKRRHPVNAKTELMMARALVCCNAYPVIHLLHLEGAEIYISFGHSVGDVMDVARWEEMGSNSGLQAAGGGENAVYVSCGGHPFLSEEEWRHTGDGPAALARFLIIAAQETGHNGDMLRDEHGRWVGRLSALNWQQEPAPKVGRGRLTDIARTQKAWRRCQKFGLARLVRMEDALKFYRRVRVRSWRSVLAWLGSKLGWLLFCLMLRSQGMAPLTKLQRTPYPAELLSRFFPDMLFNLAPEAEVYQRANPKEQEAVACIEALARVPQQVIKWGHPAVRFCSPKLYRIYYGELVKNCEQAVKCNILKQNVS